MRGLEPLAIDTDESLSRDEQGLQATLGLLRSKTEFDSIFAACDASALGALSAFRTMGEQVPERFGLIGFDGLPAGAHSWPPLTTIRPDYEAAGPLLIALAMDPALPSARIPVKLIERGTVMARSV